MHTANHRRQLHIHPSQDLNGALTWCPHSSTFMRLDTTSHSNALGLWRAMNTYHSTGQVQQTACQVEEGEAFKRGVRGTPKEQSNFGADRTLLELTSRLATQNTGSCNVQWSDDFYTCSPFLKTHFSCALRHLSCPIKTLHLFRTRCVKKTDMFKDVVNTEWVKWSLNNQHKPSQAQLLTFLTLLKGKLLNSH